MGLWARGGGAEERQGGEAEEEREISGLPMINNDSRWRPGDCGTQSKGHAAAL